MSELNIVEVKNESRFETLVEGHLAEINYRITGQTMDMYRTFVPKELGGRGIAGELTQFALNAARENGFKVVPSCSYVANYIQKHSEYQDLLAKA